MSYGMLCIAWGLSPAPDAGSRSDPGVPETLVAVLHHTAPGTFHFQIDISYVCSPGAAPGLGDCCARRVGSAADAMKVQVLSVPDRSPQTFWETVLGQLELQVTRPNFDTWLRGTAGKRFEEDTLVVGVSTDFAIEWLRSRMNLQINRTASNVAGRSLTVSFEVLNAQPALVHSNTTQESRPAAPSLHLDPALTFNSFTPVDSNLAAYRSALRFASGECAFNPLVLFGPPGLGKTHLLHAIGHAARERGLVVSFLTGEEFVSRYAATVRAGQPHFFRSAFESCDVLLIDDIQFLASRLGSQEQFFSVFNGLHGAKKRIALTCDRVPSTITGLTSHLLSRLRAGLCLELQPLSTADRLALVKRLTSTLKHQLPDDIFHAVAERPYASVRELQGALHRVDMFADLHGSTVTLESLHAALIPFRSEHAPTTVDQIFDVICRHFHISATELASQSRSRDVTYARHVAMYLLRHEAHRPLSEIGKLLGNRNHATIIAGCRRIQSELSTLESTKNDLNQLRSHLQRPSQVS